MRTKLKVIVGVGAALLASGLLGADVVGRPSEEPSGVGEVAHASAQRARIPLCDTNGFYEWVTQRPDTVSQVLPVSHEDLTNSQAHDCQRLIAEEGGQLSYGPLVALLVSTERVSRPESAFDNGLVVAEIVNHDPIRAYAPLRIPADVVSCLWIRRVIRPPLPPFWTAQIRRPSTGTCLDGQLQPAPDTLLMVRRSYGPTFNPGNDYPSTGRWMWDPVNRTQFIGIRCGKAWCEMGRRSPAFEPSPAFTAETVPGWSDEQLLSYQPPGASGLVVSSLYGRIEPSPDLRETHPSQYFDMLGEHVATITFSGGTDNERAAYARKYALACPCANEIKLYMRGERRRRPGNPAMMDTTYAFSSNQTRWQTIIRNTHTNHAGSGAVRWAWNDREDEGSWVECPPNTCCRTDCNTPGGC